MTISRAALLIGLAVALAACSSATTTQPDPLDAELKPRQAMPTGESSYTLGVAYETGQGVTRDDTRAARHYTTACETHGHLQGCNNLGVLYDTGRGVSEAPAKAVALFERACQGEDPDGCYNLGLAYVDGRGVTADSAQALAHFEAACAKGLGSACFNLATLQRHGARCPAADSPDAKACLDAAETEAIANFGRGCDAKDAPSCVNFGALQLEGDRADLSAAMQAFVRGCDVLDDARACFLLGIGHAKGVFLGTPNPKRAAARLKQACDKNLAQACAVLHNASQ